MAGKPPGSTRQGNNPVQVKDGTSCLTPVLAPGPVGKASVRPTGGLAGKSPGSKPSGSAAASLRAIVVEEGLDRLTDRVRDQARSGIEAELKSLTASSRDPKVKGGFEVVWRLSSMRPGESKALAPPDFVVYLMPWSDEGLVPDLLKRHVALSGRDETRAVDAIDVMLKREGGATYPGGKEHVSFVAVDTFEREAMRGPGTSDDDAARNETRVGAYLAVLILHELGHAMGASHDKTGIMREVLTITLDMPDDPYFSGKSRGQILDTLAKLLKT